MFVKIEVRFFKEFRKLTTLVSLLSLICLSLICLSLIAGIIVAVLDILTDNKFLICG